MKNGLEGAKRDARDQLEGYCRHLREMPSAWATLAMAKVSAVDGCEQHSPNKIRDIWRWMRLRIGKGELGAMDDFINSNEIFPLCSL